MTLTKSQSYNLMTVITIIHVPCTLCTGYIQCSNIAIISIISIVNTYVTSWFGWLVCCGLTSHSVIFQLYWCSDGTVVQFPNFWTAVGHPTLWGARGLYRAKPTPSEHVFYLLAIRGPVRVCWEWNLDRSIHSPARYLYATAAGDTSWENEI